MIIIVEGLDNCGKSTQIKYMSERLKEQGYTVHNMHYSASYNSEQGYKTYTAMYQMINSFQKMVNYHFIIE